MTDAISRAAVLAILKKLPPGMEKQFGRLTRKVEALPGVDVDARLADVMEAAKRVQHDIDDLVANSEGVAGLHMNGDVADWGSLMEGGSFGTWLSSVSELRAALAQITATPAARGEDPRTHEKPHSSPA